MGIVENSERVMLMVYLWLEGGDQAPILFAVCGGFLMGSTVLGMIFIVMYLDPLIESSATLNTFVNTFKKSFYTIYYLSIGFGVHFIRLLYGGLFGAEVLSRAKVLGNVPTFRLPLERVCFYKVIMINLFYLIQ